MIVSKLILNFLLRRFSDDIIYGFSTTDIIKNTLSSFGPDTIVCTNNFALLYPLSISNKKIGKLYLPFTPHGRRVPSGLVFGDLTRLQLSNTLYLLQECAPAIDEVVANHNKKYLQKSDLDQFNFNSITYLELYENSKNFKNIVFLINEKMNDVEEQIEAIKILSKNFTNSRVIQFTKDVDKAFKHENTNDIETSLPKNLIFERIVIGQKYRLNLWKNIIKNTFVFYKKTLFYKIFNNYKGREIKNLLTTNFFSEKYNQLGIIANLSNYFLIFSISLVTKALKINRAPLINKMDMFNLNCSALTKNMPVDLIHSVDLLSAFSGDKIARNRDIFHIVDLNEIPIIELRIGKVFKELNTLNKKRFFKKVVPAVQNADASITTSFGFSRLSKCVFGVKPIPVRNFRNATLFKRSTDIRKEWNVKAGQKVLVHTCSMDKIYGTDILIEMATILPKKYHLVFVGSATTNDYQLHLEEKINKLGLNSRVHLKGDISNPEDYIAYLSGADLGLSIMTNTIRNTRFNLLNRFADLMCAGLPIISSFTTESAKILKETDTGITLRRVSAESLAKTIQELFNKNGEIARLHNNMKSARLKYSEETEINKYISLLPEINSDRNKHCIIIFQRGLAKNRRVLRFANKMIEKNWCVTCLVDIIPEEEIRLLSPDLQFIKIPTSHRLRAYEIEDLL